MYQVLGPKSCGPNMHFALDGFRAGLRSVIVCPHSVARAAGLCACQPIAGKTGVVQGHVFTPDLPKAAGGFGEAACCGRCLFRIVRVFCGPRILPESARRFGAATVMIAQAPAAHLLIRCGDCRAISSAFEVP